MTVYIWISLDPAKVRPTLGEGVVRTSYLALIWHLLFGICLGHNNLLLLILVFLPWYFSGQGEDLVGLDLAALEELQNVHVEAITKICQAKVRFSLLVNYLGCTST